MSDAARPGIGSRWAWFKRMVLRRGDGVTYLDRLRIVQTPWFGVYLHRMDAPDPRPELHDHPWPFVTVVLCGGYTERRASIRTPMTETTERRRPWRPRRMRLDECHTISQIHSAPTRTLVIVGRRSRGWGYYMPFYIGHKSFEALEAERDSARVAGLVAVHS